MQWKGKEGSPHHRYTNAKTREKPIECVGNGQGGFASLKAMLGTFSDIASFLTTSSGPNREKQKH